MNGENAEQRMAFELYHRMGGHRSLAKVSSETGKHLNTIKNWSAQFRWQERVEERDAAAIRAKSCRPPSRSRISRSAM